MRLRRIIPAYAGSTTATTLLTNSSWDHPRVCGEHSLAGRIACHVLGIIPAYAGSTYRRRSRNARRQDHPRVCGEHPQIVSKLSDDEGSSPRMRGAHLHHGPVQAGLRIIPAYAGSTLPGTRAWARRPDHPRVCGEHSAACDKSAARQGSSPRMRGAHKNQCFLPNRLGIIPAYAGSTRCANPTAHPGWDHPRVCGEHIQQNSKGVGDSGSSPRMRGALIVGGV